MSSDLRLVVRWRRVLNWLWPDRPTRWQDVPDRLRPGLLVIARLTAAAVLAYLFTLALTDGAVDLTGALTALLVVQASAVSTLKMGVVRVGAVLSGVLIAILLSTWIGLTWWSLGMAIAASLIVATVLRLGEQALEAPISAMLILGVTNPDVAAETRVLTTLIGAGVGVAFSLIFPPALPTRPAGQSIVQVAEAVAVPLEAAGSNLESGPCHRAQVQSWLDRVGAAERQVVESRNSLQLLRDSRRLNPRALGVADVEPVLGTGLDTLENCLRATRALFVVVQAELPEADEQAGDPYGEELRAAFAVVLTDVADCIRAFGGLVVAEAEGRTVESEQALAASLEILRETKAILTELIMVDARENPASWLLRGSILTAVEQVLDQLDLEDRARLHARWREEQEARPLAQLPPIIEGMLWHPQHPYPRLLTPGQHPPRADRDAGEAKEAADELSPERPEH